MRTTTGHHQAAGARMEQFLRRAGFQTDRLTLSIARNQRALERFARKYRLDTLLAPQARGMVAAMSREECGHFIEFLQLSIHAGRKSLQTRRRWLTGRPDPEVSQNLTYLAAVVDRPELIVGQAQQVFQGMSPRAQRVAVMILLAAWQVTRQSPGLQDRHIKADVVDRMVEQLGAPRPV